MGSVALVRSLDDLASLASTATAPAVSVYLPTHVRGAETRQGPVRLKNLLTEAHELLTAAGSTAAEAEGLLAPGRRLVDDYDFWQHQDVGLAVFLTEQGLQHLSVPLPVDEQVTVGPRFSLKPLLPLLSRGDGFWVLSLTAGQVRLLRGSRSALVDDRTVDLPAGLDDVSADPDYENPVQAAPVARPGTGAISIGNAQVYGDSPPDWRKKQLVELARQVASALDASPHLGGLPVVLVADAELGGHFQRASDLGSQLAGTVETNPGALDDTQLHEAALTVLRPQLERAHAEVVEQFAELHGQDDPRAVSGAAAVAAAAHHGRVELVLLRLDAAEHGRYDPETATVSLQRAGGTDGDGTAGATDLVEAAALLTLGSGGGICLLERSELPWVEQMAAVLRF